MKKILAFILALFLSFPSFSQCSTVTSNAFVYYGGSAVTINFTAVQNSAYYQIYMVLPTCGTIANCNSCEEGFCRLITPSFTTTTVTLTAYQYITSGQTYHLVLVARNSLGQAVCRQPFTVNTPNAACFSPVNTGATFSNVNGTVLTNFYWTTNNFISYKVIVDGTLLLQTEQTYVGSASALINQGTHTLQVVSMCPDGEKASAVTSFTVPAPASAPLVKKKK